MNKGSKYKSGQRPTFRIWDNENDEWFKPTFDGWRGKIEELLLNPRGELSMRTFNDFIGESVFPDRFEIVLDEPQITDEQAWNKIAEAYPETVQSLRIALDHAVFGQEAEPQKVKVPKIFDDYVNGTDARFHSQAKNKVIGLIARMGWGYGLTYEFDQDDTPQSLQEVRDWIQTDNNKELAIRALLDGYEVEEEPKYYVKEPVTGQFLIRDECQSRGVRWDDGFTTAPCSYTENEIKKIEPDYWSFAVPVD